MHNETEADQRVMATAFWENLQVLRESVNVICDMSQMMIAYYKKRSRERYGRDNPKPVAPTRDTLRALSTSRKYSTPPSQCTLGQPDNHETPTSASVLDFLHNATPLCAITVEKGFTAPPPPQ